MLQQQQIINIINTFRISLGERVNKEKSILTTEKKMFNVLRFLLHLIGIYTAAGSLCRLMPRALHSGFYCDDSYGFVAFHYKVVLRFLIEQMAGKNFLVDQLKACNLGALKSST